MDYKKNYEDYTLYVKSLRRNKNDSAIYEEHHIMPRSLGGLEDATNKVLLTPREHYLAHFLLMKIYEDYTDGSYRKMVYAFMCMNWNKFGYRYTNSRLYERVKQIASKEQKAFLEDGTDSKKNWYSKWIDGAPHMKDRDAKEYKSWEDKTKKAVPQLRDKDSEEYKDWYKKSQEGKACLKDKNSDQYKNWYSKMMEGKYKYKKIWIYNDIIKKSVTITDTDLDKYIDMGWKKGRRLYKNV